MNEEQWDKLLHIRTGGRDDSHADQHRYPYEPTPYSVLERLANEGYIGKNNTLLDYGCGKGRVDLFLSYQTRCHTIGVEYDAQLYARARENQGKAVSGGRSSFILQDAAEYAVPEQVDRIYFFNPFSMKILETVMGRILDAYYAVPREMLLFFYYPQDEYVAYLMTIDELAFYDEIDCRDLFPGNDARERIVIFQLSAYTE